MSNLKQHCLYLIPHPINAEDVNWSIPLLVKDQIIKIQHFIVENAKTSRRYLKLLNPDIQWDTIEILELDKHQKGNQFSEYANFMKAHAHVGLMSEAGLPCIADPGNEIVRIAQEAGIKVKPLVGPTSILMALISSGLNGQQFKFNGYLPSKPEERKNSILQLEKQCRDTSQWFIETPYRNKVMFSDLLKLLSNETRLAIAMDIGGADEWIVCKKISQWKQTNVELDKLPCMFGIGI